MRKYEMERETRKKAAQAIISNMDKEELDDLGIIVDRVLDKIARELCLSQHSRALVLEYVRASVGLSIAEAIIQGVEVMVGGLFE